MPLRAMIASDAPGLTRQAALQCGRVEDHVDGIRIASLDVLPVDCFQSGLKVPECADLIFLCLGHLGYREGKPLRDWLCEMARRPCHGQLAIVDHIFTAGKDGALWRQFLQSLCSRSESAAFLSPMPIH